MKNTALILAALSVALSAWRLQAQDAQAPADECLSRMKRLGLAFQMYKQDYDESFPPADKWSDLLAPYSKGGPGETRPTSQIPVFHCPLLGPSGWGHSMNWKLSKRADSEVESPSTTVSLYETNVPRANAAYDGRDLIARHTRTDAARKSEAGGNFAFADGHVKWLGATQKPNFRIFLDNKARKQN